MADVELHELEELVEIDGAIAAAQRRALDDPDAEAELRELREKRQRAVDRAEGLKQRRQEQAEAERRRAAAAEQARLKQVVAAAHKMIEEISRLDKRIDQDRQRLADSVAARDGKLQELFSIVPMHAQKALREIFPPAFKTVREFLTADLIAAGVIATHLDELSADALSGQLLGFGMDRAARARACLDDITAG